MSCDVCLYAADDIYNDFSAQSIVKARKVHRCGECDTEIQPGTKYERSSGKSDGDIFTFKTCLLCSEIRKVFYCGGAYYFGDLWERMTEDAFPRLTTASECFRDLSPEGKTYVLGRWMRWKGLSAPQATAP